jgi:hypothetical protein
MYSWRRGHPRPGDLGQNGEYEEKNTMRIYPITFK